MPTGLASNAVRRRAISPRELDPQDQPSRTGEEEFLRKMEGNTPAVARSKSKLERHHPARTATLMPGSPGTAHTCEAPVNHSQSQARTPETDGQGLTTAANTATKTWVRLAIMLVSEDSDFLLVRGLGFLGVVEVKCLCSTQTTASMSSASAPPMLVLDPQIRDWVVLPMVLIMVFMGLVRSHPCRCRAFTSGFLLRGVFSVSVLQPQPLSRLACRLSIRAHNRFAITFNS